MLEAIYLHDVNAKDDLHKRSPVVAMRVIGDVVEIGVVEIIEGKEGRRPITRKLDDVDQNLYGKEEMEALLQVDIGDFMGAAKLIGSATKRQKVRAGIEAAQRLRSIERREVETLETTAASSEKRFRELFTQFEDLQIQLDHYKDEHDKNLRELRKVKYELAMERHKTGHGPRPEPPEDETIEVVIESAEDAAYDIADEVDEIVPVGAPGDAEDATT